MSQVALTPRVESKWKNSSNSCQNKKLSSYVVLSTRFEVWRLVSLCLLNCFYSQVWGTCLNQLGKTTTDWFKPPDQKRHWNKASSEYLTTWKHRRQDSIVLGSLTDHILLQLAFLMEITPRSVLYWLTVEKLSIFVWDVAKNSSTSSLSSLNQLERWRKNPRKSVGGVVIELLTQRGIFDYLPGRLAGFYVEIFLFLNTFRLLPIGAESDSDLLEIFACCCKSSSGHWRFCFFFPACCGVILSVFQQNYSQSRSWY